MDISKYLHENNLYCEVYEHINGSISVEIDWGDWKHDHAYCDYLMKERGYVLMDEQVTEENGSDCYSSIHYYEQNV